MRWLYHEGRLDRGDVPRVAADARGVLLGDGVFETLRTYGGSPFRLERHVERLRHSLAIARLDDALADPVTDVVHRAVAAAGGGELRIRVTIVRRGSAVGPTPRGSDGEMLVHLSPVDAERAGAPVRLVSMPSVVAATPFRTAKSTSFLPQVAALGEALQRGADDVVFFDPDGSIVECATANVFARIDGVLTTPPLSRQVLAGVTRAETIAVATALGDPVREHDISLDELRRATDVFVTSTLREVAPVVALDGVALAVAPEVARLRRAFLERVGR